jgi:hypothetical protein
LAANLVAGELAINTADGKLFYKDSSGVVQTIASKAGNINVSTFSGGTTGLTPATATSGAVTLAGTLAIANGGTGQTTASAAFNALSPITTAGDLILGNGANSATRLAIGANGYVLTSNGTTASWAASTGGVTSFSGGSTGLTPATATTGAISLGGTLAIGYGGTGAATANDAFNALAPSQATNSGKYLTTDGTNTSWAAVSSGNVTTKGLWENAQSITVNYSVTVGNSAMSAGPITIASGVAVTLPSGSRWVVL